MQFGQHFSFRNVVATDVGHAFVVGQPRNRAHLAHLHSIVFVEDKVHRSTVRVNVIDVPVDSFVCALEDFGHLFGKYAVAFNLGVTLIVHQSTLLLHFSHRALQRALRYVPLAFGEPPFGHGPHTGGQVRKQVFAHRGIHQALECVVCGYVFVVVDGVSLLPQVHPQLFEGHRLDFTSLVNGHLHQQLLDVITVLHVVASSNELDVTERVSPAHHQVLHIVELFVKSKQKYAITGEWEATVSVHVPHLVAIQALHNVVPALAPWRLVALGLFRSTHSLFFTATDFPFRLEHTNTRTHEHTNTRTHHTQIIHSAQPCKAQPSPDKKIGTFRCNILRITRCRAL